MKNSFLIICSALSLVLFPLNLKAEDIIEDDLQEQAIQAEQTETSPYIDRIQDSFFEPKRKGNENALFIEYSKGMSYSIRTREAMATSLIFENDEIQDIINGDIQGFQVEKISNSIVAIKPKLIGADTNVTIIGKSKTIYNFYIFSTNAKNRKNPTLLVYVKNPLIKAPSKGGETTNNEEIYNNPLSKFYKLPKGRTIDEFMVIGDNANRLLIDRKAIAPTKYEQIAKAKIKSKSGSIYIEDKESKALKALEIFNDNEFTYFKFNRNLASSRFPAIYQVINGKNAQVNTSIVGDYLIAKTISDEWVFKEGLNEVHIKALK